MPLAVVTLLRLRRCFRRHRPPPIATRHLLSYGYVQVLIRSASYATFFASRAGAAPLFSALAVEARCYALMSQRHKTPSLSQRHASRLIRQSCAQRGAFRPHEFRVNARTPRQAIAQAKSDSAMR